MRFLTVIATLVASAITSTVSAADAYVLPQGLYYLDPVAAKLYTDNTSPEMVHTQKVNASVGDTFDAWIQRLWIDGFGGSYEVTPGAGRGYVGHTHLVPALLNAEEQIKSAGVPIADAPRGAVASIMYQVLIGPGAVLEDHIGFVRFLPEGATTEVVWTIKLKVSTVNAIQLPNNMTLASYVENLVVTGLSEFAKSFNA